TRAMWPNQFVKVRVLLTTRQGALVVPATAIQNGPNGTFVYVVKPDQTVEARNVAVAGNSGDGAVIENGLPLHELVVLQGQFKLRPGSRVDAKAGPPKRAESNRPSNNGGGSSGAEMRSSQ